MRTQRVLVALTTSAVVVSAVFAQPGRGGSQWLTALGDAQRTSWIRADAKISVETLSKPGFELQWKSRLDNQPRGLQGLAQGVSASGVTLFVPMSLVTGSSNNVYAIDNDTGHIVWRRHFDATLPAPTPACAGGISSAATRLVRLDGSATAAAAGLNFGRGAAGYRSLLGEPGEGAPVEGRAGGPGRSGGDPGAAGARGTAPAGAGAARGAAGPAQPGRGAPPPAERIPGAPRVEESGAFGLLFCPSGVAYVISSDGMLHVVGLPSGKDIQRPAPFLPPNARWTSPVAVNTTLYAATTGNCGGAPSGIWAIDLDSEAKPVSSWKTNGGGVVGAVAFTSSGTLIAAIGPGQTSGEGKANAIVALDPRTLELKDWFTQPTTEFVTGPTILRHHDKDIVAAATKDGRILLLDASALGGSSRSTPLYASKPFLGAGSTVSRDALAAWQQGSESATTGASAAAQTSWILLPVIGPAAAGSTTTNGPAPAGSVVALKLTDAGGALSLAPGWVSHNLSSPATPLIVNGVVFTVATGMPSTATGRGTPAVLHAYDGATGKRLWISAQAMTTFASPGSLWSAMGQVYIGTGDGNVHAFGFNDERRPTNSQ